MICNVPRYLDKWDVTDIIILVKDKIMSDYNLKSELLNNGIYDFYKLWCQASNLYYLLITYGYEYPSYLIPYLDYPLEKTLTTEEFKECRRIFDAQHSRSKRLRKRITTMIEKQCLFLTLTFTDETLNNTSDTTRRRYIVRFLSQFNVPAIANKDFGKENGREHYHAIIQIDKIDYSLYDYGAINGRKVVVGSETDLRLSKYISKLTNHAIKETTKQSRLIYLHMDKLSPKYCTPTQLEMII